MRSIRRIRVTAIPFVLKKKYRQKLIKTLGVSEKSVSEQDGILAQIETVLEVYVETRVRAMKLTTKERIRFKESHLKKLTIIEKKLRDLIKISDLQDEFLNRIYRYLGRRNRNASASDEIESGNISAIAYQPSSHKEIAQTGRLHLHSFLSSCENVREAVDLTIKRTENRHRRKPGTKQLSKLIRDLKGIWIANGGTDVENNNKYFMNFVVAAVDALNDQPEHMQPGLSRMETAVKRILKTEDERDQDDDASDDEADFILDDEDDDAENAAEAGHTTAPG